MVDKQISLDSAKTVTPFERGVSFAGLHLRELFVSALLPVVIGTCIGCLQRVVVLTHQQFFLLGILSFAMICWLFLSVFLLLLKSFQTAGKRVVVIEISKQALLFLPKVFVSFLTLFLLVTGMMLVPWLLPIAPFLIWAPLFVAGEINAKSQQLPAEDDDDFDDSYNVRRANERPTQYFSRRPIWDLGFSRSVNFAMRHRGATFQLFILLLASLILPKAAIVLAAGHYYGLAWEIPERVLSSLSAAAFFGAATSTFLFLLPKSAHEEIGFSAEVIPSLMSMVSPLYRRGWGLVFCLAALTISGAWPVWTSIVRQAAKPPEAAVTLEKFEKTKDQLIFTLNLNDPLMSYRWLIPVQLRLGIKPDGIVVAEKEDDGRLESEKSEAEKEEEKKLAMRPALLLPQRVMPYAADGKALDETRFAPHEGPLKLVVYYENPEREMRLGVPPMEKFQLYYVSIFAQGDALPDQESWGELLLEGDLAATAVGEGQKGETPTAQASETKSSEATK